MPDDASLFDGLTTKPFLALTPHSLSQREPFIWSRLSVSNHEVSCALVTVDVIDIGRGTSVPSVLGMQGDLLCTARRCSIIKSSGESGEEVSAVVVWTSAAAAVVSASVAATGSTLGGVLGGASAASAASGVAATGSTFGCGLVGGS